MSAIRNLGQWVLPVFFPPLDQNLIPKTPVVNYFVPNSCLLKVLFLNLNSLTERDFEFGIGGVCV